MTSLLVSQDSDDEPTRQEDSDSDLDPVFQSVKTLNAETNVTVRRSMSALAEKVSANKKFRVIDPDMERQQVNTRRTVAALFFGQGSWLEAVIFQHVVRGSVLLVVLWVLWWAGLLFGLVSLMDALLKEWKWKLMSHGSVLMLPLPVAVGLCLCTDLVKQIILQPETYMVAIIQIQLCYFAIRMLRDFRITFWVCWLPSMMTTLFVDAYPSHYRPRFSILFCLGMSLIIIAWNSFLHFEWTTAHRHNDTWRFHGLQGSLMTSTMSASCTVLFFYIRYIWTAVVRPRNFVVLCSEVKTSHVPRSCMCTCGNLFMPDALFCRACGSKRPFYGNEYVGKVCGCGNVLMPDAAFCRICGASRGKARSRYTGDREGEFP